MARYSNWNQTVEWLYEKHFNKLHGMAYRKLGDKNQVRDMVQEVFKKLLAKDRTFATQEDAEKFLYRSFKNLLIDEIRRETRWKFQELGDLKPEKISARPDQEEALVGERINGRKLPLPEQERGIFELAYFEKKTDEEIAESLQLKINTVRYCLSKARQAITDILVNQYSYEESDLAQFFSRAKS